MVWHFRMGVCPRLNITDWIRLSTTILCNIMLSFFSFLILFPESALYQYRYNEVLSYVSTPLADLTESCQSSYATSLENLLGAYTLAGTFKSLCLSQNAIPSISYITGSLQTSYNATAQQVLYDHFFLFFFPWKSTFGKLKSTLIVLSYLCHHLLTL